MSEETKAPHVYMAIAEVMGELAKVGISKDNKNTSQNYKFRGIDDVYNALAPHLARAKLLILPRVQSRIVTERETQKGGVLFYVVLDVEFDFVSAIDGSKHVVRVVGEAMDSGDKATNKAMSAAYKYACMEAFCIPTEGDNDADATTHEVKPTVSAPARLDGPNLTPDKRDNYLPGIAQAITAGDSMGLRQLWDELEQQEQADIWRLLNSKQKAAARELLQQKKEQEAA
jgi:hypothetical protein